MIMSACPVNAAARMLGTVYYVAVSSKEDGIVYKIDVTTALAAAATGNYITFASTTTAYTSTYTTMAQAGNSNNVLLGGKP